MVRQISERYLELGCVRLLKQELDRRGMVSKLRAVNGTRPRYSFSRGALYVLLSNPLYIGEVRHRGCAIRDSTSRSWTGSYGRGATPAADHAVRRRARQRKSNPVRSPANCLTPAASA